MTKEEFIRDAKLTMSADQRAKHNEEAIKVEEVEEAEEIGD